MVHHVMQSTALGFTQTVAGQSFGRRIHVSALLALIHQENRHSGVVQDGVQLTPNVLLPIERMNINGRGAVFCVLCQDVSSRCSVAERPLTLRLKLYATVMHTPQLCSCRS